VALRASSPGRRDGPTPGSAADTVPDADPVEVARAICLRQLTAGPRSRAQLATALARRNVPADAAAVVLDRFTEVGLVDDAEFARAWVESRHLGRGLSRRALDHELHVKGVAPADRAAALETVDGESEAAAARRLVDRKLPSTRGLDPAVRARRLAGMLARRGYPPGVALRVVRAALAVDEGDVDTVGDALPDD
jgi:regulatory protein